jgi:5'-deoxynucleotidase YfbR-like HD superfamily hydrolase
MIELLKNLPMGSIYLDLWIEYDQQSSLEAKMIRNIDKFEMALQASEYQNRFKNIDLSEFFIDAENYLDVPEIKEMFKILKNDLNQNK